MDIFVSRDGKQAGPYSPREIHERLSDGRLQSSDLAWHEGAADWQPLYKLNAVNSLPPGRDLAVIELAPVNATVLPPPAPIYTVSCPFCMEPIKEGALKCKHCGEMLDPRLRAAQEARRMLPAVSVQPPGMPSAVPAQQPGHPVPGVTINNLIGYGPPRHEFPFFTHLSLTFFTVGLWLPVWLLLYVFRDRQYYH